MRRCKDHNRPTPCFYCERGVGPFENQDARIQALEDRVTELESAAVSLVRLDIRNTNLVVRMGGIGDLVILSASLKALKEKYPDRALVLATLSRHMAVLAGAPFLDGIIPVDSWGEAQVKHRFDLRYAVEPPGIGPGKLLLQDYMTMDRSDVFDRLLGVKSRKEFYVNVDEDALAKMRDIASRWEGPIIGINATCRSPKRVIPPEFIPELCQKIVENGFGRVVLFGKTEGWNEHLATYRQKYVVNLLNGLDFTEMVALVSLLDTVIAPDSAVTHIAGALQRPTIALFGNIAPKTRVSYYPTVTPLVPRDFMLECAPCGDFSSACKLRPGQYGADCMRLLTPDRILAAMTERKAA